jgi:hypothetical protein
MVAIKVNVPTYTRQLVPTAKETTYGGAQKNLGAKGKDQKKSDNGAKGYQSNRSKQSSKVKAKDKESSKGFWKKILAKFDWGCCGPRDD